MSAFSYLFIYICKIVNCSVELPGQLPVPDLHNCPVSAGSQSSQLSPVPHVFVSVLLHGAQVTVLQTVSQHTLDTCVPQSDGSTVQFMHGEIGESKE